MVQLVIKKLISKQILILLLLVFSLKGYSQEITEPAFVYKDDKKPKLSTIYNFINDHIGNAYDDDCFRGSGTVRFQVLKNGTIANLEIKGNLPEVLQKHIKRKIYETEKKWVFSDKKTKVSKWFVFMYYLDYKVSLNCLEYDEKDNRIVDLFNNTHNLILDKEKMAETPTSYLFRPISIVAYR